MSPARRRAAAHLIAVLASGALLLTGCGEEDPQPSPANSPTDAPSSAPASGTPVPSEDGERSPEPPSPAGETSWAGTKQFVTIDRAWTEDGATHLSVRSARKEVNTQFDTWEIIPGEGAFTTVTLAEDARILLTTPVRDVDPSGGRAEPLPSSPTEFVTLLEQLDPALSSGVGYDLSFDGDGQVVRVQSLYRP